MSSKIDKLLMVLFNEIKIKLFHSLTLISLRFSYLLGKFCAFSNPGAFLNFPSRLNTRP